MLGILACRSGCRESPAQNPALGGRRPGLGAGLVGRFAEIRRAAIAEADAQGLDVSLSGTSVRDAVRPDREMLQSALEILTRPGVSAAPTRHLAQGLAPRARLDAVARRVLAGVTHLQDGVVSAAEHEQLMAAGRRSRQILRSV